MALDESIVAAVANSNFKTSAERQVTNADSHQNRLQLLAEASLAQQLNRMNSLDPTEAAAINKVQGSDLASKMASLTAAIASSQQTVKGAQSTPPETG